MSPAGPPEPRLELLLDAEVYAPEPLGRRHLLLGGGRVLWIGSEVPRIDGPEVAVRPLNGRRLVPGLVDLHAHLCGGGGEAGFASRVPAPALSRYTLAGVTTAVGLLGTDDTVRTPGELLAVARGLREEGLSTYLWVGGYHLPPATLTGSVRGDLVHIDLAVGVGELALSDHRSSQPTLDELLRIAADVHVAGLMTGKAGVLHLHMGDGERGLELVFAALECSELPGRVFHPTHVNRRRELFEQALELTARGSAIDVTAFPDEDPDGLSAADAFLAHARAGCPPASLTISSDGGGCLPSFDAEGRVSGFAVGTATTLMATVRELLARGVPLEAALAPVTSNPARLLRLRNKGRIAPGMDADLLVLDDDGSPAEVMAGGHWHVRGGELLRRGTFEAWNLER